MWNESAFKKLSSLKKLYIKLSDKKQYKAYKEKLWEHTWQNRIHEFIRSEKVLTKDIIAQKLSSSRQLNMLHSGNAGDIIYALPTIKKIAELFDAELNLYFKMDQPMTFINQTHPLGGVMMNKKMAALLKPLIDSQPYITSCEVFEDQHIDIDLDAIRSTGAFLDRGNIAKWYGYTTGINADLYKSWLHVKPDNAYANTLVLARSQRYNNVFVDYSFLKQYPNKVFVGIEAEWIEIKKMIPDIKWVQVDNFLQLAEIIAGCKLFIGNQSLPFAIAEGLKIPRILETFFEVPNVITEGPNGYDFYFQGHLVSLVKELMQ